MKLLPSTKIGELLDQYPFLLDFLPTLSPKFNKLKNPVMRRTMGRIATLNMVANIGEMDYRTLVNKIEEEINRHTTGPAVPSTSAPGPQKPIAPGPKAVSDDKLEKMKNIITDLHKGVDINILKKRFAELIKDVSPTEISRMEQRLIDEGMPASEVKRLCDVHVQVFQHSLDAREPPKAIPGHPVHTLMEENRISERILEELKAQVDKLGSPPKSNVFLHQKPRIVNLMSRLDEIEKHYLRKENQLFPRLEAHGITGPSQVMWAIHDDIRAELKNTKDLVSANKVNDAVDSIQRLDKMINDMVYKEEHILYPVSMDVLTEEDWLKVKHGEEEIGYAWVEPGFGWPESAPKPAVTAPAPEPVTAPMPAPERARRTEVPTEIKNERGALKLDTGELDLEQINLMLKHLPVDLSFVDENDSVAYYSAGKERIFPRSPGVIGRKVQKCHPPKSVHVVEKILSEFKAGSRDVAEFWIQLGGKFIYIRYFAVRDTNGKYRGTLEVSQDLNAIKKLEGERRLLDWK